MTASENHTTSETHPDDEQRGDGDAVCFSAGLGGAIFGTGAIHAYLASDRKPPEVAAGIHFGALCAAAMQRGYRELVDRDCDHTREDCNAGREAARWTWFRRFLNAITDRPLKSVWRAMPKRSDYFAPFATLNDYATPDRLFDDEDRAAYRRDVLTGLGRWVARLPVTARELSLLASHWVGSCEPARPRTPCWPLGLKSWLKRGGHVIAGLGRLLFLVERVFAYAALNPVLVPYRSLRLLPRPVVGGWTYLGICLISLTTLVLLISVSLYVMAPVQEVFFLPWWVGPAAVLAVIILWLRPRKPSTVLLTVLFLGCGLWSVSWWDPPLPSVTILCSSFAVAAVLWFVPRLALLGLWVAKLVPWVAKLVPWVAKLVPWVAKNDGWMRFLERGLRRRLGLDGGLLSDYYLHRQLEELFETAPPGNGPRAGDPPFPVVIAASAIEPLRDAKGAPRLDRLLYAGRDTPIVDALLAALRPFQLLGPKLVTGDETSNWVAKDTQLWDDERQLHLVSGVLTRRNPLPALFQFLRNEAGGIASRLSPATERGRRAIHVLYEVPLAPKQAEVESSADEQGAAGPQERDIIDVVRIAYRLAARRDTQLEVRQTRFISRLEEALRKNRNGGGEENERLPPLFLDEIAPEDDLEVSRLFEAPQKSLLKHVAAGCRRTLETLYAKELQSLAERWQEPGAVPDLLPCATLLRHVARQRRPFIEDGPGLPDVCRHCPRQLAVPRTEAGPSQERSKAATALIKKFPNLTGENPRIVFVASGGVFRGAFQVGIMAALVETGVRPDLVAGASVGALLAAVLAKLFALRATSEADEHKRVLRELVACFVEVDERIALTRRLREAVRELATRAATIDLAPSDVRRAVLAGSRSDPGFAATGAPPALIDAIATLLLTSFEKTREATAEFLADHNAEALEELIEAVKRDTLRRLGIRQAVLGHSLLEQVARDLLGGVNATTAVDRHVRSGELQPFYWKENGRETGIAFFATATNLETEELTYLGDEDLAGARYDFVKAVLASSAFPGVFSPLRESDIFPGRGRSDVFYADGGIFDNLPILPALDILVRCQRAHRACSNGSAFDFLKRRHKHPDLFLVGSLEVAQDPDERFKKARSQPYPYREGSFKTAVKIRSFQNSSSVIHQQLDDLPERPENGWDERDKRVFDGTVDGAVLPIEPADDEHLNPTFAFATSIGLNRKRVKRSIAHGCFQTLAALSGAVAKPEDGPLKKAIEGLRSGDGPRIPRIAPAADGKSADGKCPYFTIERGADPSEPLSCPFFAVSGGDADEGGNECRAVYSACKKDKTHGSRWQQLRDAQQEAG